MTVNEAFKTLKVGPGQVIMKHTERTAIDGGPLFQVRGSRGVRKATASGWEVVDKPVAAPKSAKKAEPKKD